MAYQVILRSSQRDIMSKSKPVPTRAEALELGKRFLDEALVREKADGWWNGEVVSVSVEATGD